MYNCFDLLVEWLNFPVIKYNVRKTISMASVVVKIDDCFLAGYLFCHVKKEWEVVNTSFMGVWTMESVIR